MAKCAKCGAEMAAGATFCGSCGAAVSGASSASAGSSSASTGMSSNVAGLLSYILAPLTSVLFLVLEPYNKDKFVRFHAFQGLFFGIACIVLSIALMILSGILALIPIVGWIIGLLFGILFPIALFFLWIFLMYKAYNNEKFMLPVIGPMAAKQAG